MKSRFWNRRQLLLAALAAGVGTAGWAQPVPPKRPVVKVWKDPNCGCCKDWIVHLEQNGFQVTVDDSGNTAARARFGLPERLGSCHTALVEGYVVEGHVPAADIQRLLKLRPAALGLAVPGMPIGSPGMDGPAYGGRRDRFDVLLVQRDGSTRIFNTHNA